MTAYRLYITGMKLCEMLDEYLRTCLPLGMNNENEKSTACMARLLPNLYSSRHSNIRLTKRGFDDGA